VIVDMLPAIGAIWGSQPAPAVGAAAMGEAARARDTSPTASFMTVLPLGAPAFTIKGKACAWWQLLLREIRSTPFGT
jgi:hypothetical protein